jgi:multiple sugar transport system substrate-binding protein
LLEKYGYSGPPKTWDALTAMARKVQQGERPARPEFYGYVWQGAQYEGLVCNFLEAAASAGGGLPIENGNLRVNSKANSKALALLRNMVGPGGISAPQTYSSMQEEETRLYFERGDALFERNWPYAWPLHQSEKSPVRGQVGIAPLPSFPGQNPAAALGGWHVGISRFTDAPEAARELALYLVSLPVQKRLALELGWNPGRREVYGDPDVLARYPHFRELRAVFSHALARPGLPYYSRVSEVLQRHLNAALAGKTDPTHALQSAQEEIDALTARYGGR